MMRSSRGFGDPNGGVRVAGLWENYGVMYAMRPLRNFKTNQCCHLISRIANRAFFLNDEEKTRFVERLWRVATFSCVEVLAYCFMSNHFHILVYVPDPRELSDDELLARIRARNTPLSSPYTTESGQCSRLKVYVPSNRRRDRRSGSTRPASQGRSEAERDVSGRYKPV